MVLCIYVYNLKLKHYGNIILFCSPIPDFHTQIPNWYKEINLPLNNVFCVKTIFTLRRIFVEKFQCKYEYSKKNSFHKKFYKIGHGGLYAVALTNCLLT